MTALLKIMFVGGGLIGRLLYGPFARVFLITSAVVTSYYYGVAKTKLIVTKKVCKLYADKLALYNEINKVKVNLDEISFIDQTNLIEFSGFEGFLIKIYNLNIFYDIVKLIHNVSHTFGLYVSTLGSVVAVLFLLFVIILMGSLAKRVYFVFFPLVKSVEESEINIKMREIEHLLGSKKDSQVMIESLINENKKLQEENIKLRNDNGKVNI